MSEDIKNHLSNTGDILSGITVISKNVSVVGEVETDILLITKVYTDGALPSRLVGKMTLDGVEHTVYLDRISDNVRIDNIQKNSIPLVNGEIKYFTIPKDHKGMISVYLDKLNIDINSVISVCNTVSGLDIYYKQLKQD